MLSVCALQMKFVGPLWGPTAVPLIFALAYEETEFAITRTLDMLTHLVPELRAKVAHYYLDGGRAFLAAFGHHFPTAKLHRCLQHVKKNVSKHVGKTRSRTSAWFLRTWMDITACVPSDALFLKLWAIIRGRLEDNGDHILSEYIGHVVDLGPQWRCDHVHTPPGFSTYASNSQESLWEVLRTSGVKGPYNLLGLFEALDGLVKLWMLEGRFAVGQVFPQPEGPPRTTGRLFSKPVGLNQRPEVLLTGDGWKGPANCREFDSSADHRGPVAYDEQGLRAAGQEPKPAESRRRQFRRLVVKRMLEVNAITPIALEIPLAHHTDNERPERPWLPTGRHWVIPKVDETHYDEDRMKLWYALCFAPTQVAVEEALQHESLLEDGALHLVKVQRLIGQYTWVEDKGEGQVPLDWHFDFQKHGCSEHSIFMEVQLERWQPIFVETRSARTLLHQRARELSRQQKARAKAKSKAKAKAKAQAAAPPAEEHGPAEEVLAFEDDSVETYEEEWEDVSQASNDSLDYLFHPGLAPPSPRRSRD